MIKIILSDLDGTLLPYGKNEMSDRFLEQITKLKEKGIIFCAASGRTIPSFRKLFKDKFKDCYFIGENGAIVFDGSGKLLGKTIMPKDRAIQIANDYWNMTDNLGEVLLSGESTSYLMCRETTIEQRNGNYTMEERLLNNGNKCVKITSPDEISEDIIKVSVFVARGIAPYVDRFANRFGDIKPAIAGPYWLDTMTASKATGVKILSEHLGIDPRDMMAFGDNYNDVPMLDAVGIPYIMSSSATELLNKYPNHTDNPEDVIEAVINGDF